MEILESLIENYEMIKTIRYGLENKTLENFERMFNMETPENVDKILASRYINKILILVYYECQDFTMRNLENLLSKAKAYKLIDLQAEICFLRRAYPDCINAYMSAEGSFKGLIF